MNTSYELQQLRKLEKKREWKRRKEGLPHLYAYNWYAWAKEYFDSLNKLNFICAANQISKSSSQIRKCIHWATSPNNWSKLWKHQPRQFWYLYPTKEISSIEFETKWDIFMPCNEYKDHPVYGWKAQYKHAHIYRIMFNTGVTIYFKSYAQDAHKLQAGSCDAVFCFTAGHTILTSQGDKLIEDIKVGDYALTREGTYERITKVFSRDQQVIRRDLTNGKYLEGTPNHEIFTRNRGYVALRDLTPNDVLVTPALWKKTLLYIKAISIPHIPILKIAGITITNATLITKTTEMGALYVTKYVSCIMRSISMLSEKFQKATSYITEMAMLQIIPSKILSVCLAPNTMYITRKNSGPTVRWAKRQNTPASGVEKTSHRGPLKKQHASFVQGYVGEERKDQDNQRKSARRLKKFFAYVSIAVKNFINILPVQNVSVLSHVVYVPGQTKVFNITVENNHNYFINGVSACNCDEEISADIYPELMMRLAATDGYFSMVFTATLGEQLWYDTMEMQGTKDEQFPGASKWQVSMYDCQQYLDGSPTQWTDERIAEVKANCGTEAEVQRRVYGRFVVDSGLKYPTFTRQHNVIPIPKLPLKEIVTVYSIYSGVDIGSGGSSGHPAAIVFIAVAPNFQKGYVFRGWRGNNLEDTTASDILEKYRDLRGGLKMIQQSYDWASADFHTFASRVGETFVKADKSVTMGEDMINVLFKNKMLFIADDPELTPLMFELETLQHKKRKSAARDDFIDALRYAVTSIPWDYSGVALDIAADGPKEHKEMTELEERRAAFWGGEDEFNEIEEEIDYFNQMFEE